jgi:hypothetical protein
MVQEALGHTAEPPQLRSAPVSARVLFFAFPLLFAVFVNNPLHVLFAVDAEFACLRFAVSARLMAAGLSQAARPVAVPTSTLR